jgi:hypothetical protein
VVDTFPKTHQNDSPGNLTKTLSTYRDVAIKLDVAFILVNYLRYRKLFIDRKTGIRLEDPIGLKHVWGGATFIGSVDTIISLDTAENRTREINFLKNRYGYVELILLRKPMTFQFKPGTAVPFLPNKETVKMISRIVG